MARFHPLYGGHILQMRRTLPRLSALQVDGFVATGSLPGQPARERLEGIEIRRVPTAGRSPSLRAFLLGISVFAHLVRWRRDFDVLHIVGAAWHNTFGVLAAKLLGKKVLIEMVLLGSDDPATLARTRLGPVRQVVWKRADRIVSLSSALTEVTRREGVAPAKIVQIPVGVDVDLFTPVEPPEERRRLRETLGLPLEGEIVVFLGAITPRKGVDLLVEAWPRVVARHPRAHLLLIGPVDEDEVDRRFRASLVERIDAAGLSERVVFAGRVEDVADRLRASDVFVLPSSAEGLPNSILEAMACGLPAVMTDIPGIGGDVIRSAAEGTLVAERSPEAFADALLRYLDDPDLRRSVGEAARRRILERFSLERRAQDLDRTYREMLREPGG